MRGKALRHLVDDTYLSTRHPEYPGLEIDWLTKEWVRQSSGYGHLRHFADRQAKLVTELKRGDSRAVFQAIQLLGPMALWGDSSTAVSNDIPELVRAIITSWYDDARVGSDQQRRVAAAMLRRLGAILAGEQRGRRRRGGADPREIWEYCQTIRFRLTRARRLLPFWKWDGRERNREQRVHEVARACGVPVASFEMFVGLHEGRRPFSLTDCAFDATAKAFSIAAHTVSNALTQAVSEPWSFAHPVIRLRQVANAAGKLTHNPLLRKN